MSFEVVAEDLSGPVGIACKDETGRVVDSDTLFDVGASSLTLIQIHENIDEAYPGVVDLTELFDFPTISMLAKHVEAKLEGRG